MIDNVGILSLQGDVLEHEAMINKINPRANVIRLTKASQLKSITSLILPGGESTTMNRLGQKVINDHQLMAEIKDFITSHNLPVLATCAGLILLAKEIQSMPERQSLKPFLDLIPIRVLRNNYGRQQNSFEVPLSIHGLDSDFNGIFIRAPVIELLPKQGNNLEVLGTFQDSPVIVKQKNIIGCTFHPELTTDTRIHEMFMELY